MRNLVVICSVLLSLAFAVPSTAQEEVDKGFLTNLLQDSLSGAGRDVQIDGFAGSLSSNARLDKMTIADAQGIWLTLTDVSLIWSRAALLRGRVEVDELRAATLVISRKPETDDTLPAPEAAGFALPDLPVSVNIGALGIDRVELGAEILGQPLTARLSGAASLAGGSGTAKINAVRLDQTRGSFSVDAQYDRSTQAIALDITLSEAAGGLAAMALNVPDAPSVDLTVRGAGPIRDFTVDLALATQGQDRLAGQVVVGTLRDGVTRSVEADISGDITSLFAPEYQPFFGPDVALVLSATRSETGFVDISNFKMDAQSADFEGKLRLDESGWPSFFDITGLIADAGGQRVTLPATGDPVSVRRMGLDVSYDAASSDVWEGRFDIDDVLRNEVRIDAVAMDVAGLLTAPQEQRGAITAEIDLKAVGIDGLPPDVARALGRDVSLTVNVEHEEDRPTTLKEMVLTISGAILRGDATIGSPRDGLPVEFDLDLSAQDFDRFSGLAGQPLTGSGQLAIKGTAAPLAGSFDVALNGAVDAVSVGIAQLDPVLAGRSQLELAARRDETGTFVDAVDIRNAQIALTASAELRSGASTAQFDVSMPRAAVLLDDVLDDVPGSLEASGTATQFGEVWRVDMSASGPYDAAAQVRGAVTGPEFDVQIEASLPDASALSPDLSGPLTIDGQVTKPGEAFRVDLRAAGPFGADASVVGIVTGPDFNVDVDLRLPDIAALSKSLSGPLALDGTVTRPRDAFRVDLRAGGPYGVDARVAGIVTGPEFDVELTANMPEVSVFASGLTGALAIDGRVTRPDADWRVRAGLSGVSGSRMQVAGTVSGQGVPSLDISGTAPLGLAQRFIAPRTIDGMARFDLRLAGGFDASNLSGTATANGARLSVPSLRFALENLDVATRLSGGQAQIEASARGADGGSLAVTGRAGFAGAGTRSADITARLSRLIVADPQLYKTSVSGDVAVSGPLQRLQIRGALVLDETNVIVPSTGLASIADIPPITHVGATAAVRETQNRAGFGAAGQDAGAQASAGAGLPIDLSISAPSRIFVRGRGLDAELGGQLRLTGTTANLISAGRFELLRGRLSILEQRFDLTRGSVQLQGDFEPFIEFVAVTNTDAGTAQIAINGPAASPEITFSSTPETPQDEVLANLLFGRDLSQMSPLQALKLANAVAVLAGKSGSGIIGSLRGAFDLDDIDLGTAEDGSAQVRVGKYISDKAYTDVAVDTQGNAEVSINIDLTPNLTARGTAGANGGTSLGLFFEKDY